jgi:N-acyl-D-amino-acid deacylase
LSALVLLGAEPKAKRPITGEPVAAFQPLDEAIQRFMDLIPCTAATVAVSKDAKLLYSRGYGWRDARRQKPTQPDTLMRIASLSKPITAAAVRKLIGEGKLAPELEVFPYLGIRPYNGKEGDRRLGQITVARLLEHKGGWDMERTFDPLFRTPQIEKALHLRGRASPRNVIEYMLAQPLQFDPGARYAYSNFGYCVLGRVLEKAAGKPFKAVLDSEILRPLKITDVKLGHSAARERDPREVWYPVADNHFSIEVMDAHGGLIASAGALCRFMDSYWLGGQARRPDDRFYFTFFGSFPGTTAMARQRPDGINVAVLLNNRREKTYPEDDKLLQKTVDEALDRIMVGRDDR